MKHIHIFIVIALLTLIAGCSVFNDPLQPQNTENLAQVRVNIGSNARTLLPDFNFSKYELNAEPAGDNDKSAPPKIEKSGDDGNGMTIIVPLGEWNIIVTAYVKVGATDYPAAKGSVNVEVWGDRHVNVTLNMPESGGTGTFAYTVTYPAGGSATVKLEPWPSGTAVINNVAVGSSGAPVTRNDVPSGIYFLTVKATSGEKTVTRNEIVHIYRGLSTNANYIFTKVDFGNEKLKFTGTVNVLFNGQQPDNNAIVAIYDSWNDEIAQTPIDFSGSSGSGTWSVELNNLRGANTLYFRVHIPGIFDTEVLTTVPVTLNDITGIDLGSVTFDFDSIPIEPNNEITGTIPLHADFVQDWYSMEVTADTNYSFWWDNVSYMMAAYSNGEYIFSASPDWGNASPSFTATRDATVYLRVVARGEWDEIDTYAFGYSAN
jgi:hypothetical protein